MSANEVRLLNLAAVFVVPDLARTTAFYRDRLGFRADARPDAPEPFAMLYRDSVEIVLVQGASGSVEPNRRRYGAGYDAYLSPDDVDGFHEELLSRGVRILSAPAATPYGTYEFTFEDLDGRIVGAGQLVGGPGPAS
jgi:catechol 2,3-dioxygenase-like lactoylglutathione lyase family enzyme